MTTWECLERAARIEDLAGDVYSRLADRLAHDSPFRDLFVRLASEETEHGRRIRLLGRHVGRAAWPARTMERIGEQLERLAGSLAVMAREAEDRDRTEDPAALLRWVVDVERSLGSVHAEALCECLDPEVRRLFASLARQDSAHRILLEDGAARAEARRLPA